MLQLWLIYVLYLVLKKIKIFSFLCKKMLCVWSRTFSKGFAAKSPNVNWEFYCNTFLLELVHLLSSEKINFSLMNLCSKNLSSNGKIEDNYETHFSFECPSWHRLLRQFKIFSKTFQYIYISSEGWIFYVSFLCSRMFGKKP